jgi:hypothetical protein
MAVAQMLSDRKAETTTGLLSSAADFFARHGIGVRLCMVQPRSPMFLSRYSRIGEG